AGAARAGERNFRNRGEAAAHFSDDRSGLGLPDVRPERANLGNHTATFRERTADRFRCAAGVGYCGYGETSCGGETTGSGCASCSRLGGETRFNAPSTTTGEGAVRLRRVRCECSP